VCVVRVIECECVVKVFHIFLYLVFCNYSFVLLFMLFGHDEDPHHGAGPLNVHK